jgi:predicted AAA+ superfamily ATPase
MHLYSAKNVSLIQNFQMEQLFQYSQQLINQVDTAFTRYVYDRINWKNRLVGLVGFRGVGKTTLILQHIKKNLKL